MFAEGAVEHEHLRLPVRRRDGEGALQWLVAIRAWRRRFAHTRQNKLRSELGIDLEQTGPHRAHSLRRLMANAAIAASPALRPRTPQFPDAFHRRGNPAGGQIGSRSALNRGATVTSAQRHSRSLLPRSPRRLGPPNTHPPTPSPASRLRELNLRRHLPSPIRLARIAEIVAPDAMSHGQTLPAGEEPNGVREVCDLVHTPSENFTSAAGVEPHVIFVAWGLRRRSSKASHSACCSVCISGR